MRLLALDPEGIAIELESMERESKSLRRNIHDLVFIGEGRYGIDDIWMMTAETRKMLIEMFTEHHERRRRSLT